MKSSHSINLGIREDIKSIINDKNAILIQMICSKNQKEEIIGINFLYIS